MITVNIQSGDAADIFVTVTDNNRAPAHKVVTNLRLNYGSAPSPIQISEDAAGRGNIDWHAVRCDDRNRTNGRNETPSDGDTIYVNAA